MFGVTLLRQKDQSTKLGSITSAEGRQRRCFSLRRRQKNFFIHSRYAGREHSRSFDFRFECLKRGPDNFSAQARIKVLRQARIAARMRDTDAFDNTIRSHLHRDWKHRAH